MGHNFKPVSREPLYVKVYQAIEADILSGVLEEGAFLPTEGELCEQLGVTRSSVREGIRSLEQAGLVTRGAAKRLVVQRPQTQDVAAAASRGWTLGGVTFDEVWEVLATLYPHAAGLAASRSSKAGVDELFEIRNRLASYDKSEHDKIVQSSVAYFQCLTGQLNNRVLVTVLQSLNMMIGASLRRVIAATPQAQKRIARAQLEITEAISQRDAPTAQRWMAKHIDDLKRGYSVARVDMSAEIFRSD
ncbi:MAG: GntR family transcriptional regulator [Pseudomonadota bacterium]